MTFDASAANERDGVTFDDDCEERREDNDEVNDEDRELTLRDDDDDDDEVMEEGVERTARAAVLTSREADR